MVLPPANDYLSSKGNVHKVELKVGNQSILLSDSKISLSLVPSDQLESSTVIQNKSIKTPV